MYSATLQGLTKTRFKRGVKVMIDNDIIKALECCTKSGLCRDCPYNAKNAIFCRKNLQNDALALINRQEAENRQLAEALECANARIKELKTKIECDSQFDKWKHLADVTEKHYEELYQEAKESVRAAALKEAASKFAGHSDYHGDTILSKLICIAEGKEVGNAIPLNIDEIKAEVVKKFATKFLRKIHEHHYLLTAHYNSKDYGMFTTGIEQIVNETMEEMVGENK